LIPVDLTSLASFALLKSLSNAKDDLEASIKGYACLLRDEFG
jgi:hypothetical protein